jgi:peptidyl-prolyl cis-trans isomerase A (cyclophilin A)
MLSLLAILVACGGAEPAAEDAIVSTDPPDAVGSSPAESPVSETEPDVRPEPDPEPESDPTLLPPLLNPAHPDANATAPAEYRVVLDTTKGDIVLQVYRHWAPLGADRFYNLVRSGFFTEVRFFRVVDGFVAQFGMNGDPDVNAAWDAAEMADDPSIGETNSRGRITFAHAGPDTRTTQLFLSIGNNAFLDSQGFPPFGEIIEGLDALDSLYKGYGEGPPQGRGPDQGRIGAQGNSYLEREFPDLDYVRRARLLE